MEAQGIFCGKQVVFKKASQSALLLALGLDEKGYSPGIVSSDVRMPSQEILISIGDGKFFDTCWMDEYLVLYPVELFLVHSSDFQKLLYVGETAQSLSVGEDSLAEIGTDSLYGNQCSTVCLVKVYEDFFLRAALPADLGFI